jgi:anti-sigma factor RsiW
MACKDIVWKIGPFIDGELPASEQGEVETHLGSCADCRETAMAFRHLDEVAGRQEVPPVSGQEWTRLWEGVVANPGATSNEKIVSISDARPSTWERSWSPSKKWLLVVVAAAAVFVLGVFVGSNLLDGPPPPKNNVANSADGKNPAIQHAAVQEPDAGSELDYVSE